MTEQDDKAIQDGIDAMVRSLMQLIEPCVRIRCEQFVKVFKGTIEKND